MTQSVEKMEVTSSQDESSIIRRGLVWETPGGAKGLDLARRLVAGTVTAEEIVRALEPLGVWWGLADQYGGLAAYESHAEQGWDPVTDHLKEYEEEKAYWEGLDPNKPDPGWVSGLPAWQERIRHYLDPDRLWSGGTVAVILTAKRPMVNGVPWDPEVHNPAGNFLSGNSYLPRGEPLEIVEVRYDAGNGYRVLRANGIRTTASGVPGLTVRVGGDGDKLVAMLGGQEVGFLEYESNDDEDVETGDPLLTVTNLWVDPSHRRQGIATALYDRLEEVFPFHVFAHTNFTHDGAAFARARGIEGAFPQMKWVDPDHRASLRTALPSWRDRGSHPSAEAVIAPDLGRGRRNSYSVYLYGQPYARRSSLAEAKATVEAIYGLLDWVRVEGDVDPHHDRVWGPTTMFNDADYFLVVERLPRLGATAAYVPDPMQYTVRVEFGRRRSDSVESPEGPMTPAYLDINAGERYVVVWAHTEAEAKAIACEMVASGGDTSQNPVARTGDMPTKAEVVKVAKTATRLGLVGETYMGTAGNRSHITRNEKGYIPTADLQFMLGASGERPGQHRKRQGAEWDAFVADIRVNGIREPIFITVDPGEEPRISEGNHRRDAALEAGLREVPVNIRYFGKAEDEHLVAPQVPRTITPPGAAMWDGTVASRTASSGTIYRGLRVPITDEIKACFKQYLKREELVEKRAWKIGPLVLDAMEKYVGRHSTGVGIHWSTRPEMAGVAAETGGQFGELPVILTATYTDADVVPEDDDLYDLSAVWVGNQIESEVLIKPGARLRITGVWILKGLGNSQVLSADKCPTMNVRGDTYANVLAAPQPRTAAAAPLEHWRPTKGMFARGSDTLDPRVFDPHTQQMRADVRDYALNSLDSFWTPQYGDWQKWARLYLAGSGASYWWDSDSDLDFLIGVNLDALREIRPANKEVSDADILAHLNHGLIEDLRPTMADFQPDPSLPPMTVTYFVNPGSYDIANIHPYAAYDVTDDGWVVKPPVLPANWGPDSIPEETWRRCEMAAREAEQVLSLPEPERTLAGTIYFDWVHEGRQAAYSAHGGGWLDPGNVIYQYLSQHPEHLLRRLYLCKHPEEATAADAVEKTAATGLPPGYTFDVTEEAATERWGLPKVWVRVKYDGKQVGSLSVHQRLIDGRREGHPNVYVDPEHQRKGLATAMYAEVKRRWPEVPIVHSEHASDAAKALNRTLSSVSRDDFGRQLEDLRIGDEPGYWTEWQEAITEGGVEDTPEALLDWLEARDLHVAARTATSTMTVYRGIYLGLESGDYDSLPGSIVHRVLKGGKSYNYGVQQNNLGVHWTTDKRVAQYFATPMTRRGEKPTLGSDGWGVSVPVLVTAKVSSADVVTDEKELRDAMVEGHGWEGLPSTTRLPEQEVLVRPGAPIQIESIEALSPAQWWRVRQAVENFAAGNVQNWNAEWKRLDGGMRAVAAKDLICPTCRGAGGGRIECRSCGRKTCKHYTVNITTPGGTQYNPLKDPRPTKLLGTCTPCQISGKTGAKTIDMTPEMGPKWKGNGIYEMDISRWSTTGCVALMMETMGTAWPIGWLTWDRERHTVEGVYVNDAYRGKGIGTELLKEAEKVAGTSLKNDSGEYTSEGLAWAKKRGIPAKMKSRVSLSDMARMVARMNNLLIGSTDLIKRQVQKMGSRTGYQVSSEHGRADDLPGEGEVPEGGVRRPHVGRDRGGWRHHAGRDRGGSGGQGLPAREPRPPLRVAEVIWGIRTAGPLDRSFEDYSDETQAHIKGALRALANGKVTPEPKRGDLEGVWSIPVGSLSPSSTPERLLLVRIDQRWAAVYYTPDHDYQRATVVLLAWRQSLRGKQAQRVSNLGWYAKEWRWQDWAKRNGGAHLFQTRSLPTLRKAVEDVFSDYGVTEPVDIEWVAPGSGYSEGGLIDGKAHLRINRDEKNLWNALHEAAHVVCDHQGMDPFDSDHGPGFRLVFQDIMQAHGGVDVEFEANPH